jgi:DNA-binding response OmpR family regulator
MMTFSGLQAVERPGGLTEAERLGSPRVLILGIKAEELVSLTALFDGGGFSCSHAPLEQALGRPHIASGFDLVVVDNGAGEGAAMSFCRELKGRGPPIMILSEASDVADRVIALELGADDLLGRPFHKRELLARARALVRRSTGGSGPADPAPLPRMGVLHTETRMLVGPDKAKIMLTPNVFEVLRVFLSRPDEPLSAEEVTGLIPGAVSVSHFRTTIIRLRRKLAEAGFEAGMLASVRSDGYRLDRRIGIELR